MARRTPTRYSRPTPAASWDAKQPVQNEDSYAGDLLERSSGSVSRVTSSDVADLAAAERENPE